MKGVNKNVIEIQETGNVFFERAILFVRPENNMSDPSYLHGRAADFLAGLKMRPKRHSWSGIWVSAIKLATAAAAGAGLATLFFIFVR